MTNYNERLDEILEDFGVSCARQSVVTLEDANEAKQALTSLTKEMVAEAMPEWAVISDNEMRIDRARKSAANYAVYQFEQNLLKALEEK